MGDASRHIQSAGSKGVGSPSPHHRRTPKRLRRDRLTVSLERWRAVWIGREDAAAVLGPDGSVLRTFGGIEREADAVAEALRDLGEKPVVGIQAPNCGAWPAMLLGVWKAGGVVLLEDFSHSAGVVDAAEALCGAVARLETDGAGWGLMKTGREGQEGEIGEADLIKLTSGTTGVPSAILFTAEQIAADCDQVCETMGIGADDVNYGVIAFSHSYGFSNLVTPLLLRGVPVVAARDALPRAMADGLAESGATVLPAVPAIFRALCAVEALPERLRLCISAGAPLPARLAVDFHGRFGLKVHSFYGASECGGICYDGTNALPEADGFVGLPMKGVKLERRSEAAEDGFGICVRSPAAGLGYFPAAQEVCLEDGYFCPPDLLAEDERGYRIVGRRTDVINVAGRKVNPAEIERALLLHPGIREAVVFGVADSKRTQAVWAWVVAADEVTAESIRRFCAERLADWQVPREIVCVEAIPVTDRGKVSRRDLAERFGKGG